MSACPRVDYSPGLGTELRDVQLLELGDEEVDELAELVSERGVVFLRDQSMTLDQQVRVGRMLGELHTHPAAQAPEGFPEVLVLEADPGSTRAAGAWWHTDVSCDQRPPALSMLRLCDVPSSGGDTVWSSMYAALDSLSSTMQGILVGLTARHTGAVYQSTYGMDASEWPVAEHPVVRTHPVTGRRALYVNQVFTSEIVGMRPRESEALLGFLFDHIAYGVEFQTRFRWEPDSVAIWDNRCVQHHAVWDYHPESRLGYRVTTVGERPVL